jgi:hypothetical protein
MPEALPQTWTIIGHALGVIKVVVVERGRFEADMTGYRAK